jgi:hypothetical protein
MAFVDVIVRPGVPPLSPPTDWLSDAVPWPPLVRATPSGKVPQGEPIFGGVGVGGRPRLATKTGQPYWIKLTVGTLPSRLRRPLR